MDSLGGKKDRFDMRGAHFILPLRVPCLHTRKLNYSWSLLTSLSLSAFVRSFPFRNAPFPLSILAAGAV